MLSREVNAASVHPSSGQDANALADQMVRQQQAAINKFVARQRQQIELGEKDVHYARLPLPGIDVHYTQVQGLERLHYHISPEAEARAPLPEPEALEELKPEGPKQLGQPDFLTVEIPFGLAVEFGDGAT